MQSQKVKVWAPATVANVVCGFDVLGLALNAPGDELELELVPNSTEITIENLDNFCLPTETNKNVCGAALKSLVAAYGKPVGFRVKSHKHIKPGSGIGSSSASAAGAVVAANHLLNNFFSKKELVDFAMDGEALASGSRHADNVAPCIYGGVTLVRSSSPLDIISLSAPELFFVVLHPQIEVRTADSRAIIKQSVPLKAAVQQWANVAGLVAGFLQKDYDLIGRSLHDGLIEPVRSMLIPGFHELKKAAMDAGALGGGISGSGPSVFMMCRTMQEAEKVKLAMQENYASTGLAFDIHLSTLNLEGVKVIS
jgi:homoserine kinase